MELVVSYSDAAVDRNELQREDLVRAERLEELDLVEQVVRDDLVVVRRQMSIARQIVQVIYIVYIRVQIVDIYICRGRVVIYIYIRSHSRHD